MTSVLGRTLAADVHKPLASGKPGKVVVAEKDELLTLPHLPPDPRPSSAKRSRCRCARS